MNTITFKPRKSNREGGGAPPTPDKKENAPVKRISRKKYTSVEELKCPFCKSPVQLRFENWDLGGTEAVAQCVNEKNCGVHISCAIINKHQITQLLKEKVLKLFNGEIDIPK